MGFNKDWIGLREMCPLDIGDITKEAKSIERDLRGIKYLNDSEPSDRIRGLEKVKNAKVKLYNLIQILVSLIREPDLLKTKTDQKIVESIYERAGRLLRFVDIRFEKMEIEKVPTISKLVSLSNDILENLYAGIYTTLLKASEREPENKHDFLRAFFLEMDSYTSTFGSVSREEAKLKNITQDFSAPLAATTHTQIIEAEKKAEESISDGYYDPMNIFKQPEGKKS